MKALNYRRAFDSDGNSLPWLSALKGKSGVYVIRNEVSRQTLYVGESHTNRLDSTIKRHFYEWKDDKTRKHFVFSKRTVEVAIRICKPGSAVNAQNKLIQKLEPKHNTNGYEPEPF